MHVLFVREYNLHCKFLQINIFQWENLLVFSKKSITSFVCLWESIKYLRNKQTIFSTSYFPTFFAQKRKWRIRTSRSDIPSVIFISTSKKSWIFKLIKFQTLLNCPCWNLYTYNRARAILIYSPWNLIVVTGLIMNLRTCRVKFIDSELEV